MCSVDQIPQENPLKPLLRAVESLTAYATAFRYPTPSGRIGDAPDEPEFDGYANAVDLALGEAAARFGVTLSSTDAPAKNPGPAR